MKGVRPPAVAGLFYPAEPRELRRELRRHLEAGRPSGPVPPPRALVVPHAGYRYSGPVAGRAYAWLRASGARPERVVLLGPAHHLPFRGFALSSAEAWETPLGLVRLDPQTPALLADLPGTGLLDEAHVREHSLEVQLPFLQEVLGPDFLLAPVAAGLADTEEAAALLERLWGGPETLILVSTDLSHFHDAGTARRLDRATCRAVEALRPEDLDEESACGRVPLRGLLRAANRHGLRPQTLDLRNSADTAGFPERVVGYGAWAFLPADVPSAAV